MGDVVKFPPNTGQCVSCGERDILGVTLPIKELGQYWLFCSTCLTDALRGINEASLALIHEYQDKYGAD